MLHTQENGRKKHQRVYCPYCNSMSRVTQQMHGVHVRVCRNRHEFHYDPACEGLDEFNSFFDEE